MAIQLYLIQPKDNRDDHSREQLAELVASRQGYILMATSYGSLIVALDEDHVPTLQAHQLVAFVGGVTLNPEAPGAAALEQLFAQNLARQLAEQSAAARAAPTTPDLPPGYRPLRWNYRFEEGGG